MEDSLEAEKTVAPEVDLPVIEKKPLDTLDSNWDRKVMPFLANMTLFLSVFGVTALLTDGVLALTAVKALMTVAYLYKSKQYGQASRLQQVMEDWRKAVSGENNKENQILLANSISKMETYVYKYPIAQRLHKNFHIDMTVTGIGLSIAHIVESQWFDANGYLSLLFAGLGVGMLLTDRIFSKRIKRDLSVINARYNLLLDNQYFILPTKEPDPKNSEYDFEKAYKYLVKMNRRLSGSVPGGNVLRHSKNGNGVSFAALFDSYYKILAKYIVRRSKPTNLSDVEKVASACEQVLIKFEAFEFELQEDGADAIRLQTKQTIANAFNLSFYKLHEDLLEEL